MNEHDRFQEMIAAMLDGELPEREQRELMEHLAVCDRCSTMCVALAAVSGAMEPEEVPGTLHADIMARVDALAAKEKKRGTLLRFRPLLISAACFGVIVGAVLALRPVFRGASSAENLSASSFYSMTTAADAPAAAAAAPEPQPDADLPMGSLKMATDSNLPMEDAMAGLDEYLFGGVLDEDAYGGDTESESAEAPQEAGEWPELEITAVSEDSFTAVVLSDPRGELTEGQEITVVAASASGWKAGDRVRVTFRERSDVAGHVTIGAEEIERLE